MIVTRLPDVEPRPRRVAVGTFDGVHLGHREVIRGADTVLTFDPHPRAVVSPASVPPLLTPFDRKVELIAELGVAELVVIPFDLEFAAQSAEAFHDDVLVAALGATHVSVGENFHYGAKARGDTALLQADGRFAVRVLPLLESHGEIVSSSHIRGLIAGGAVEHAGKLLGAAYAMTGEVVHGEKRGRTPTFVTGLGELVEAFLIDWEGDLYGRQLRVDFLKRLRGEKRFDSVEALLVQMAVDVEDARGLASLPSRT